MKRRQILISVVVVVLCAGGVALADLADGLLAYYPFNGNANDETGNPHDGTVYGATLTADRFGNPDSAYGFDGSGDYIDLANPTDFMFKNESFSVSLWTQVMGNSGYEWFFTIGDGTDGIPRFSMAKSRAGYWDGRLFTQIYLGGPASDQEVVTSILNGDQLPKNTWMHLVAVVDYAGGELEFFVDGESQGTDALADFDLGVASSPQASIGMLFTPPLYHGGPIDDVRIYSRALTSDEVAELHAIPVPGAALLGMLGLCSAAAKLRRRSV